MFETALVGGDGGRGWTSFSGSLVLQCGIAGGLLCVGLLLPVAQPELPELRIAPPAPRFQNAMKILTTSVARSSLPTLSPRIFVLDVRPRAVADTAAVMERMADELPAVGIAGSVITSLPNGVVVGALPAPPPPKPAPVAVPKPVSAGPILIGGNVLASKLIVQVKPNYPVLARQARISGVVLLQGTITKEGRIAELRVISGHPLLVQASLEAVRQWVYSPTLLNGQPVEVQAPIEVRYSLGQ